MAAEQLACAVEVFHRLLALAAPLGDLGEALEALPEQRLDTCVLPPLDAAAEVRLGLVDPVERQGQVAAHRVVRERVAVAQSNLVLRCPGESQLKLLSGAMLDDDRGDFADGRRKLCYWEILLFNDTEEGTELLERAFCA